MSFRFTMTIAVVLTICAVHISPQAYAAAPSLPESATRSPSGPALDAEPTFMAPALAAPAACPPAPHCAPQESQREFYEFFAYLVRIPDTVLKQGDAATQAWIRAHPRGGGSPGARPFMSLEPSAANPYRCTLAVAALLVTTALPAFKILRLKKLIQELGGVGETTRLVIGATSAAEKGEAIINGLKELVGALLGIAAVKQYCFS